MEQRNSSLPAPIAEYLTQEIPPLDLANLLDGHLHDMVEWIAKSEQLWTDEQVSAYHHIRKLRDLFVQISNAKPVQR